MKNILIIMIVVLSSCTTSSIFEDESKENIIKVFHKNSLAPWFLEETDSMSIIALETNDNCLIKDISRIYLSDNNLIIFDRGREVLTFNMKGKFIKKIGKHGKGPGEFIQLTNVDFDLVKKHIEIFDNPTKRMMIYDLNGNFVTSKKSCINFISFIKCDYGYYVYSPFVNHENSKGYNLFLLSHDLKKIKNKYLTTKNNFDRALFAGNFTRNGNEIFFRHGLNDTIYRLYKDKIEKHLTINFEKYKVPYDKVKKLKSRSSFDEIVYFHKPRYLGQIEHVLANDKQIIFTFTELGFGEKAFFSGLYQRQIDSIQFFGSFHSRIPGIFSYFPKYLSNKKKIFVINPGGMEQHDIEIIRKKFNVNFKEDSNPLLLIQYE